MNTDERRPRRTRQITQGLHLRSQGFSVFSERIRKQQPRLSLRRKPGAHEHRPLEYAPRCSPIGAKIRSSARKTSLDVIPTKARESGNPARPLRRLPWTPAFAGVTTE